MGEVMQRQSNGKSRKHLETEEPRLIYSLLEKYEVCWRGGSWEEEECTMQKKKKLINDLKKNQQRKLEN
jgi:hypothetical protein